MLSDCYDYSLVWIIFDTLTSFIKLFKSNPFNLFDQFVQDPTNFLGYVANEFNSESLNLSLEAVLNY